VWTIVLAMEPASAYRYIKEEKLEDVALSFADFSDLKSFYSAGHSRRVGDLAERMAQQMRLPGAEVTTIRVAALMHDLGLVTVPSFILQKPRDQLTPVEWERLRLHPYHAERILARVPILAPVVPLIAAHHERMDGHGYYRGLVGAQIPLGARIIAVADRNYLARWKHIREAIPARKLLIGSVNRPFFRGCSENVPIANPFPGIQHQRLALPPQNLRACAMCPRCTRNGIDVDHHLLLIEGVDQSIIVVSKGFHGIEACVPLTPDPEAEL
jgi:hypothetical protein